MGMIQYILVAITFVIAVLGWFKGDKPSRLVSIIVAVLLLVLLLGQGWQLKGESVERERLERNLVEVRGTNDSLLIQNRSLLSKNDELLKRIGSYQDEIEGHSETIEALSYYAKVAKLGPNGQSILAGPGLKSVNKESELMKGVFGIKNNRHYCNCIPSIREKLITAINQTPIFPFSYYCLAICLRKEQNLNWRSYAQQAVEIFEKTTRLDEHHATHDDALQELLRYLDE